MKRTIAFLLGVCLSIISVMAQEVPILLTAKYNQTATYNISCPEGAVTGCGTTAIEEILNLYKLPEHGYGEAQLLICVDSICGDLEYINFNLD